MTLYMREQEKYEEGMEEGIEKGTDRVNALNEKLVEAGRIEDLIRSTNDREFQKQLLEEFRMLSN